MNRCLACHQMYFDQPGWLRIFMLGKSSNICQMCESKLISISGKRCVTCSRSLDGLRSYYVKGEQCLDCWRWEQSGVRGFEKNVSIYEYNSFLKEWLSTYKFRGDAIVATFFAEKLEMLYHTHFSGYVPVALPLSSKRLQARGFNQSKLLMQNWAEGADILHRREGEKQSKKNRKQRVSQITHSPFSLKVGATVRNQNFVLIDDIYTTGTTVRQAASILTRNGARNVSSLTVAR
ncbi:ComF family protein [Alkalihalobacillus sp. MEB130]|uniref:ComF family protein n=1 Tax=Alkalihalobacillus sp. MEB130 TaxID=2976704 RepID=UPI0028DE2D8E|nr:phosphoribosyltransferase family protein [Alkalihalobacillus sp. MEB130]MDT8858793.1 ComF family protein [Alkalihalobacillus sp. MEB130]